MTDIFARQSVRVGRIGEHKGFIDIGQSSSRKLRQSGEESQQFSPSLSRIRFWLAFACGPHVKKASKNETCAVGGPAQPEHRILAGFLIVFWLLVT